MYDRYQRQRDDRRWDDHQRAVERSLTFQPTFKPFQNKSSATFPTASYSGSSGATEEKAQTSTLGKVAAGAGALALGGLIAWFLMGEQPAPSQNTITQDASD